MKTKKTYFTSDLHFGHKNIIAYDQRPFFSVEEMDRCLIKYWNDAVSNEDEVYILGDVSWYNARKTIEILNQLNGQKHLVIGNHDNIILKNSQCRSFFETISPYVEKEILLNNGEKRKVIMSHYFIPLYNGHYKKSIMLHGHSHTTEECQEELKIAKELNKQGFTNEIYNVGCMHWDYRPMSLDELIKNRQIND